MSQAKNYLSECVQKWKFNYEKFLLPLNIFYFYILTFFFSIKDV
jgi:hypothetical protein